MTLRAPLLRSLSFAVLVAAFLPRTAHAQNPKCDSLSGIVVYGAGGSAATPLLGHVANVLLAATEPIRIVYQDQNGACSGVNALTGVDSATIAGTAWYWDGTVNASGAPTAKACDIATPVPVGLATTYGAASLCPVIAGNSGLLDGLVDLEVAVSAIDLLVPPLSSVHSLSAEAVYLLYGLGAAAGVSGFDVEASIIHRDPNNSVQRLLGIALGLPLDGFRHGTDASSGAVTKVNAQNVSIAAASATLGFASHETADANRAKVRTIAYQHFGQTCGYTPDSTESSFDKANVRDGQYALWSTTHVYARRDATTGAYESEALATLFAYLAGTEAPAGTDTSFTDAVIATDSIPLCAMQVARDGDFAPFYSAARPDYCGCYFESRVQGSTRTCAACAADGECGGGTARCRRGVCEAY